MREGFSKIDMSENSEYKIIFSPEYEALKEEVEKLRTEVSIFLLEEDELRFTICKNIEAEYMAKIGGLEYRAYKKQCDVLRLKRKMEMIQAAVNRQEKADLEGIEKQLDLEFSQYQKNLDAQMDKMNEALRRLECEKLSKEDSKELKKLYRLIVKALHPDLHPEASRAQRQLFENAVSAYKNGDLEALRAIYEVMGSPQETEDKTDTLKSLSEEKERLEKSLKAVMDDIDQIKSRYPYTMKEILEDENKTEAKKEELEKLIKEYEEMAQSYQSRIDALLKEN